MWHLILTGITKKKMDGFALVFLDDYISREFDFCIWDYCYSNGIYIMAIPRDISSELEHWALDLWQDIFLMLFIMHNR